MDLFAETYDMEPEKGIAGILGLHRGDSEMKKPSTVDLATQREEFRLNIRQSLQYLVSWLSRAVPVGDPENWTALAAACVPLPGTIASAGAGEAKVSILDDLATVERSRW